MTEEHNYPRHWLAGTVSIEAQKILWVIKPFGDETLVISITKELSWWQVFLYRYVFRFTVERAKWK